MKSIVVVSLLLLKVLGAIVNLDQDIICSPSDPSDCYPQIFVPTKEWQIIREGQDIPPGLHVRLNINTLQKEAKILDKEDEDSNSEVNAIVLSEEDIGTEKVTKEINNNPEQIKDKILKAMNKDSPSKKSKVSFDDLNEYSNAVEEIQVSTDIPRLEKALDTLIELSHDIEFGVKLTSDKDIFLNLLKLGEVVNSDHIEEKSLRIMASALRNNEEALGNVLKYQNSEFVDSLFNLLKNFKSDVLQKRTLGIIHAFTQNPQFNAKYFNCGGKALTDLIQVYPQLGTQSKQRLVNILQDTQNNSEIYIRDTEDPDTFVSSFLQDYLSNDKPKSENELRTFFNQLSNIHSFNSELKPSSKFLEWLAEQVTQRAEVQKRDSISDDEKAFNKKMLEDRHLVFGNPNALRKAMNFDEL